MFCSSESSEEEEEVTGGNEKAASEEVESEGEIVLPPDELHMKDLKKLETMKESPA